MAPEQLRGRPARRARRPVRLGGARVRAAHRRGPLADRDGRRRHPPRRAARRARAPRRRGAGDPRRGRRRRAPRARQAGLGSLPVDGCAPRRGRRRGGTPRSRRPRRRGRARRHARPRERGDRHPAGARAGDAGSPRAHRSRPPAAAGGPRRRCLRGAAPRGRFRRVGARPLSPLRRLRAAPARVIVARVRSLGARVRAEAAPAPHLRAGVRGVPDLHARRPPGGLRHHGRPGHPPRRARSGHGPAARDHRGAGLAVGGGRLAGRQARRLPPPAGRQIGCPPGAHRGRRDAAPRRRDGAPELVSRRPRRVGRPHTAPTRIDLDTGAVTRTLDPPAGSDILAVVELPDGRVLARLGRAGQAIVRGLGIYAAGASSAPRMLTEDQLTEALLVTPDGHWAIAGRSTNGTVAQVIALPLEGGPTAVLPRQRRHAERRARPLPRRGPAHLVDVHHPQRPRRAGAAGRRRRRRGADRRSAASGWTSCPRGCPARRGW